MCEFHPKPYFRRSTAMWLVIAAYVIGIFVGNVTAADAQPPEESQAPQLDLDTLASVVEFKFDGAYAGAGVVVTPGGKVITSLAIGQAALKQKVTIRDLLNKDVGATLVSLDAKHGFALFQMRGVIPRGATVERAAVSPEKRSVAICAFGSDGKPRTCTYEGFMTVALDAGPGTMPHGGTWPIYDSKTRRLKALLAVSKSPLGTNGVSVTRTSDLLEVLKD